MRKAAQMKDLHNRWPSGVSSYLLHAFPTSSRTTGSIFALRNVKGPGQKLNGVYVQDESVLVWPVRRSGFGDPTDVTAPSTPHHHLPDLHQKNEQQYEAYEPFVRASIIFLIFFAGKEEPAS